MAAVMMRPKKTAVAMSTRTVGQYLLDRLHQMGVQHIFGLPGDYILRFDKMIEEHPIQFINATRENTAGYMADAYARCCGLGVACITYGVGINIANALAQAYVESSPVVVISGAAGTNEVNKDAYLHHLIKTANNPLENTQLEIFKHLTVAQAVLDRPEMAANEIERVLTACKRHQKPVYIELPRDMVDAPIYPHRIRPAPEPKSDQAALQEALKEIAAMLKECRRPVLWLGHEIQRFGLASTLMQFAERYRIPIVSTLLGKAVVDEHHPLFVGVYQGRISRPEVSDFVESCDCIFTLGAILSDVDTGIFTAKLDLEKRVIATADTCQVSLHHYQGIVFSEFIQKLGELNLNVRFRGDYPANIDRKIAPFVPVRHKETTVARIFECLQKHLKPEHIVVSDIGDALFGSVDLILEQNAYLAGAYFSSLGFGTPGAIGAQIAMPKRRVIGIVGDGAFQMTSMELSTAIRYNLDPIIIVLNNHGYGTERPILEGGYNDIVDWNYTQIPRVLGGGLGIKATTEEEFDRALTTALSHRGSFTLIEVDLDKTDFSPAMRRFSALLSRRK